TTDIIMEYTLWKALPDAPLNTELMLYKIGYYGCIPNFLTFTSDKENFKIKELEKDFPYFVEDNYDKNNPLFCSITCTYKGENPNKQVEYKVNNLHLQSLYHLSNAICLSKNLLPELENYPLVPLKIILMP